MSPPDDLLAFPSPQRRIGGYSRNVVDDLLDRAAQTVETLLSEVRASHEEIARLESAQAALEDRLENAARRTPEEVVGEVLMTAQRAAENLLDKARAEAAEVAAAARRDVAPILADAQATLERASTLHREAQAAVEQARVQAESILEAARDEREQMVADVLSDAAKRRTELEVSNLRLETAIKGLRTEWAARAAEALARLESIGLEPGSPSGEVGDGESLEADAAEGVGSLAPTEAGADPAPEALGERSETVEDNDTDAARRAYDLQLRLRQAREEASAFPPDGPFQNAS